MVELQRRFEALRGRAENDPEVETLARELHATFLAIAERHASLAPLITGEVPPDPPDLRGQLIAQAVFADLDPAQRRCVDVLLAELFGRTDLTEETR